MRNNECILVSVIMPTFNTKEEYLRAAIESILDQTHKNFEFIITVDGSTNEDLKIVREYEQKDNRVKVIDNYVNRGLSFSLNNMIMQAVGEYVFRMDSDDISVKTRLADSIAFFQNHPNVDICGAQVKRYLNGNLSIRKTYMPVTDAYIKTSLLFCNPMIHPVVAFRRDSIIRTGCKYTEGVKSEDYKMWVDCAINGLVFANMNKVLLYYRIHNNQITQRFTKELYESGFNSLKIYVNHFTKAFSNSEIELFFNFSRSIRRITKDEIGKISVIFVKFSDLSTVFELKKKSVLSKRFARDYVKQIVKWNADYSSVRIKELGILDYSKKYKLIVLLSNLYSLFKRKIINETY